MRGGDGWSCCCDDITGLAGSGMWEGSTAAADKAWTRSAEAEMWSISFFSMRSSSEGRLLSRGRRPSMKDVGLGHHDRYEVRRASHASSCPSSSPHFSLTQAICRLHIYRTHHDLLLVGCVSVAFVPDLVPISCLAALITVSLLPSSKSTVFSTSLTVARSRLSPVIPLHNRASSRADMACSVTSAGMKRAKSGFITSSEAQMIAMFISSVDHTRA